MDVSGFSTEGCPTLPALRLIRRQIDRWNWRLVDGSWRIARDRVAFRLAISRWLFAVGEAVEHRERAGQLIRPSDLQNGAGVACQRLRNPELLTLPVVLGGQRKGAQPLLDRKSVV